MSYVWFDNYKYLEKQVDVLPALNICIICHNILNKICHIKANACHPQYSWAVLTIIAGHFIKITTIHTLL